MDADNIEKSMIRKLKQGDAQAAGDLINRYYDRVLRAARRRLDGVRLRGTSEEDVAASVFESLWRRADEQRFSDDDLASPEELWKLLSTMVRFKSRDHVRNERRLKRGGDRISGESVFTSPGGEERRIQEFAIDSNSLESMIEFREQHQALMDRLPDDTLREVATQRLEGFQINEIAEKFDRSDRWVKRKLALIRDIWSDLIQEQTDTPG